MRNTTRPLALAWLISIATLALSFGGCAGDGDNDADRGADHSPEVPAPAGELPAGGPALGYATGARFTTAPRPTPRPALATPADPRTAPPAAESPRVR